MAQPENGPIYYQLADESDISYAAFFEWLKLPSPRMTASREIREALLKLKKRPAELQVLPSYRTIARWIKQFRWVERARAYDVDLKTSELAGRLDGAREAGADDELRNYRERLLQASKLIYGVGTRYMTLIHAWSNEFETKDPSSGRTVVKDIPSSFASNARAAKEFIEDSLEIEASVHGVSDIIAALSRSR